MKHQTFPPPREAAASIHRLPARTTPVPVAFRSSSALVILDTENLVLSARDARAAVDFGALRRHLSSLRSPAVPAEFHAVYSEGPHDAPLQTHLVSEGWIPHTRPPIHKRPHMPGHCNADLWVAMTAAHLMGRSGTNMLMLGTGDGLLGLDISRGLKRMLPRAPRIGTVSFHFTTSRLLNAQSAKEIDFNIFIGRDCLHRLH